MGANRQEFEGKAATGSSDQKLFSPSHAFECARLYALPRKEICKMFDGCFAVLLHKCSLTEPALRCAWVTAGPVTEVVYGIYRISLQIRYVLGLGASLVLV